MGTLESRYASRIQEFRQRAERGDEDAGRILDEEIQYVLDTVPFIKEYSSTHKVDSKGDHTKGLESFVEVTHKSNKNNVLQRYLMHVEKQVDTTTMAAAKAHGDKDSKKHPMDVEYFCEACDAGMVCNARESMLVCLQCGRCRAYAEMNATNLTYEQEIHQDVVTYFAYKRLNHFCEWLNSLQAKVRLFFVE